MEMIRQIDPNRQITLMHPDEYSDSIKQLAKDYGAEFHDTGYMSAFYADYNPTVMRGAGLPFSLEPGGPAKDLDEFKKMLGLWQVEGLQGVDYFIHIGDILWKPDIKAYFEAHRRQLTLLGQIHSPKAQTGILYSDQVSQLTGYPWGNDPNANLEGGYWNWNPATVMRGYFPYDGLTQSSFGNGEAAPYGVVVDSNTSIMDEKMVSQIEAWVRAGGTFVTFAQTGRHTPEKADSWPIERLTGYHVARIDQLRPDGSAAQSGRLAPAPDQTVFGADWDNVSANGLHLNKVAPDAQNLLMWKDGSVAAGYRPLGQGFIVQLGAKFTGPRIADRVEPGANKQKEVQQLRAMMTAVLNWRGVAPEPGQLQQDADFVTLRHSVSNNGFYDVWTMWNQNRNAAQTVSLQIPGDLKNGLEVLNEQNVPLANVALQPLETRVLVTSRAQSAAAPLEWLNLQRQWWRGTTPPPAKTLPTPQSLQTWTLDLTADWAFQPLDEPTDGAPLAQPNTDDAKWTRRDIGTWNTREVGKNHALFRKQFTIPADWKAGVASVWVTSWSMTSFLQQGRVFLDGKEIAGWGPNGARGFQTEALKPGTSHVLAVEARAAKGEIAGLRGSAWVSFTPAPQSSLDLGGDWQPSTDAVSFTAPVALPGDYEGLLLRRTAIVPAQQKGNHAVLNVDGDSQLVGVIVNGRLVRRHHHRFGQQWNLDISPYLKWGAENEFMLVSAKGAKGQVRNVSLNFYGPQANYP